MAEKFSETKIKAQARENVMAMFKDFLENYDRWAQTGKTSFMVETIVEDYPVCVEVKFTAKQFYEKKKDNGEIVEAVDLDFEAEEYQRSLAEKAEKQAEKAKAKAKKKERDEAMRKAKKEKE